MTHYELCKKMAERCFKKNADIVLFEYQSFSTGEFPDVLAFSDHTTVYEIKIVRSDFLADSKKYCRRKTVIKYGHFYNEVIQNKAEIKLIKQGLGELIKEAPHLGKKRYYVCPENLIQPDEILNGWGLYWFKNNKFYLKKESGIFRNDTHHERLILQHAMRKFASGKAENVFVKPY